jgi:hypothetical protein
MVRKVAGYNYNGFFYLCDKPVEKFSENPILTNGWTGV